MDNNRLTTAQVAALLGVTKRTVIRYANKHKWTRHTTTDKQNRPVTMYDLADIEKHYPVVCDAVPVTGGHDEPTATATTAAQEALPATVTADNEALTALLGAMQAQTDRKAQKITRCIALCALLLALSIVSIGLQIINAYEASKAAENARAEKVVELIRQDLNTRVRLQAAENRRAVLYQLALMREDDEDGDF